VIFVSRSHAEDLLLLRLWLRTSEVSRWRGNPHEQATLLEEDLNELRMLKGRRGVRNVWGQIGRRAANPNLIPFSSIRVIWGQPPRYVEAITTEPCEPDSFQAFVAMCCDGTNDAPVLALGGGGGREARLSSNAFLESS